MPEIKLTGCAPTPLAHYLKALGILRLLAENEEHGDPEAVGCWQGESLALRTRLDRDGLERFFLEHYQPTPIIAPWNGGSGFYPKDNKAGFNAILESPALRFAAYRDVLRLTAQAVAATGLAESPKEEAKSTFLSRLRAVLPETVLPWLDAAVVLGMERPGYPPLLGTGGNDGRLDFTNNFMQRLVELFSPDTGTPTERTGEWLAGSLFAEATPGLVSRAIGQFSPGRAGGPNAGTGFDAGSLVNPWDFVLMLEGALLFAGAATRRMESNDPVALSYPFTVRTTGSGSGSGNLSDESKSRAEIWMPLWDRWSSLGEIRQLLTEGRVTLGRRPARDGLDFGRAVASLGIDRGINAFQRYGFLMRSGKAYLATPLNRIAVRQRANPQAELTGDLDQYGWLERLRRFGRSEHAPNRIRRLVRQLEDALFNLAQRGERETIQNILCLLGEIDQSIGVSAKGREAVLPMPWLRHPDWVRKADDGSHEFHIAVALAGIAADKLPMRSHLAPVAADSLTWEPGSKLTVWGGGGLCGNLARVLERRLLEADRLGLTDKPLEGTTTFPRADLAAVNAFLARETDDDRIARLLGGLVCVKPLPESVEERTDPDNDFPAPAAFGVLKPMFTRNSILQRVFNLPEDAGLPLPKRIPRLLLTGNSKDVNEALEHAWRRMRIAGIEIPKDSEAPQAAGIDGARLLAALMIPLRHGDLRRISRLLAPSQNQGDNLSV
jgi:CRISPR-associated protein Csx17